MPTEVLNFDELNIINRDKIRAAVEAEIFSELPERKIDRKRVEDIIFALLTMAYAFGIDKAGLDLGEKPEVSEGRQEDAITAPTAGMTAFQRMDEHIHNAEPAIEAGGSVAVDAAIALVEQLTTLIETEAGRVTNTAIFDAAEDFQRKNPNRVVMKRWVAVLDDRTRDTHFYLDGTEVPLDAYFYSYSGDRALFPHGFQTAQENTNCRCSTDIIVY